MSLADYKHVALETKAQPVVDGKRQHQKYYFNGVLASNSSSHTLARLADRMQKKAAVKNALKWLSIKDLERKPTIANFYKIPIH
jgi:hypothetical protein